MITEEQKTIDTLMELKQLLQTENEHLYQQYNHLMIRNQKLIKRIDDQQLLNDKLQERIEEMERIIDRLRLRNDSYAGSPIHQPVSLSYQNQTDDLKSLIVPDVQGIKTSIPISQHLLENKIDITQL